MVVVVQRILFGLCLAAGLGSAARASTILTSTAGNAADSAKSVANIIGAESFVATGSGIGDVEVALSRSNTANGSVLITIVNDSNNKPSTTVRDTIAILSEGSIGTTEGLYDFYHLPIDNLTLGSRYWLEVGKSGTAAISTSVYTTNVAPSVGFASTSISSGATNYFSGAGSSKTAPLMVDCISTDDACDATYTNIAFAVNAAPEPASAMIFATAVVALSWLRVSTRHTAVRRRL